MAIEIRGLKGKALLARTNVERLNSAYDKFNEIAVGHAVDVEVLASQIEQHHEDLSFAAGALGNYTEQSSGDGASGSQPQEKKPDGDTTFQGGSSS